MFIKSSLQRLLGTDRASPTSVIDQHLSAIDSGLRAAKAELQRWPPPAQVPRHRLPDLTERHGRMERELAALKRDGQDARSAHRLMTLAAETRSLHEEIGLTTSTAPPDLGGEGESAEDARWFDRERLDQDKLRSLEARHRPSGYRLFRHQIQQAEHLAGAVEQALRAEGAPRRAHLGTALLNANERAGRQLAAAVAAHGPVVSDAGALRQRLDRLAAREDAACFSGERRDIQRRIDDSLAMGTAAGGGWHKAEVSLAAGKTWLARLESDLARLDALPGGWRALSNDRRDLDPQARTIADRRIFRAARLMTAEGCGFREAMAMSRRAERAVADGCPETSALVNEQVRRGLLKRHPEGVVDPLVRMLRMEGTASPADALAVLQVLTRMPAAMAEQLAAAGLTICPSPGRSSNAAPRRFLEVKDDHSAGFYSPDMRRLVVTTTRTGDSAVPNVKERTAPLHEAAHAYEHLVAASSHRDADFAAARDRDLRGGHIAAGHDDYFRHSGDHFHSNPSEETYAESLAMYLVGDRRWPALHAHWESKFRGAGKG